MKKAVKVGEKSKVKKARVVEVKRLEEYGAMGVDTRISLIQELIPLGLMYIEELLQEEVVRLSGDKYKRNGQALCVGNF